MLLPVRIEKNKYIRMRKPCIVQGCDKLAGFHSNICAMHQYRHIKYGSFDLPDTRERFLNSVFERVSFDTNTGCWMWGGNINHQGYARIQINKKVIQLHRFMYELFREKIPPHMNACHVCDTPGCVNPFHIFIGTQKDNVQDSINKGRRNYDHIRGENNYQSKVTSDDVLSIRKDARSTREIAKDYGLTQSSISLIKRGKNWAHLKEE